MTPTEFGFWLKGLVASGEWGVADMSAMVLKQAAQVLDHVVAHRGPAKIPALRQYPVPDFCAHNVSVSEHCAPCARDYSGLRLYWVRLPTGTRVVYTGEHASGTDTDAVQQFDHSARNVAKESSALATSEAGAGSALGIAAEK